MDEDGSDIAVESLMNLVIKGLMLINLVDENERLNRAQVGNLSMKW